MSTFDNIVSLVREVQGLEGLNDKEVESLITPKRVSQADLKVNGQTYPAWRIVFNDGTGPGKGGIRFHPEVSEDEVKSLSFWMSIKNSLAGLPYGGGKGGVKFDPKNTDAKTIDAISREYVRNFHNVLGENIDVPAPDVYTNAQIMGVMLDEFEKIKGYHEPGMITGKPLELGGIALRGDATARGAYIVFQEMVAGVLAGKKDLKVAVQGYGNAGAYIAQMAADGRSKVVAVSDSQGGIYSDHGLDISEINKVKTETGRVDNLAGGTKITNAEILELDVDVLFLAALENQITAENANNIKAKHIIELANGPVDFAADKILFEKGVMVVPDILANAGGVVVSYFEWCQNRTGNILDEDYLRGLLEKKMKNSWQVVYEKYQSQDKKANLRTCAYAIAIRRILAAKYARGDFN
jgi:glutamate dehydrogenase/leucine dehydrogenase